MPTGRSLCLFSCSTTMRFELRTSLFIVRNATNGRYSLCIWSSIWSEVKEHMQNINPSKQFYRSMATMESFWHACEWAIFLFISRWLIDFGLSLPLFLSSGCHYHMLLKVGNYSWSHELLFSSICIHSYFFHLLLFSSSLSLLPISYWNYFCMEMIHIMGFCNDHFEGYAWSTCVEMMWICWQLIFAK